MRQTASNNPHYARFKKTQHQEDKNSKKPHCMECSHSTQDSVRLVPRVSLERKTATRPGLVGLAPTKLWV